MTKAGARCSDKKSKGGTGNSRTQKTKAGARGSGKTSKEAALIMTAEEILKRGKENAAFSGRSEKGGIS